MICRKLTHVNTVMSANEVSQIEAIIDGFVREEYSILICAEKIASLLGMSRDYAAGLIVRALG